MAWRGLDRDDLGRVLDSSSLAADLLDRKSNLTMQQAWTLHKELGIPADILLQPTTIAVE